MPLAAVATGAASGAPQSVGATCRAGAQVQIDGRAALVAVAAAMVASASWAKTPPAVSGAKRRAAAGASASVRGIENSKINARARTTLCASPALLVPSGCAAARYAHGTLAPVCGLPEAAAVTARVLKEGAAAEGTARTAPAARELPPYPPPRSFKTPVSAVSVLSCDCCGMALGAGFTLLVVLLSNVQRLLLFCFRVGGREKLLKAKDTTLQHSC